MKVRRVTLEVEVPWEFNAAEVLECLAQGFDEIGYSGQEGTPVPHQVQIISDALSINTQIGGTKQWPPK